MEQHDLATSPPTSAAFHEVSSHPAGSPPLEPARRSPAFVFFREFLRAPAMIGSVIPTSASVVKATLNPLDWQNVQLFVEYGPGLGTFTHDILARLPANARLIAIDTNPRFIDHLCREISDPRFSAVHGSAADVGSIISDRGHESADYILSGLPFSTLPHGIAPAIMQASHAALRPGGAFLIYQYSRFVLPMLQEHFSEIDEQMIWRNIPPCRIFSAHKGHANEQP
jgi:phospholipid N-methyltransferase